MTVDAKPHHVLVVEDDLAIGTSLLRGLRAAGFTAELQTEGTGAVDRALACGCDAVVLDLMLPGASGLEILAALRGRTAMPIVVLTARVDLDARLQAFADGAADFVAKPFFVEELVARLRARLGGVGQARRTVRFDDVEIDLDGRQVRVAGADAGLTGHELNVLVHLVTRPGRAVTRRQLVEHALSADADVSDRTVDSHVTRVRRKLGDAGVRLRTVWGVGYRFDPPHDGTDDPTSEAAR